jgi:hypothetical protein
VKTKIVEATNYPEGMNWGKFLLMRPDEEWSRRSKIEGDDPDLTSRIPLLRTQGWGRDHLFVMDLATGEGAMFLARRHEIAVHQLMNHRIWVCPLFEPFLEWLFRQDLADLDALPDVVELPEAPSEFRGYRRPGPEGQAP